MFDTLLHVDHAMQMFHDLLDAGNLRPKVRSMVSVLVSMAEMKPNTALLIKAKWANLILEGKKHWEVRGTSTSKREVVALAVSGTKKLWGQVEIKDCILIGELHEGKLVKGDALEENFIGNSNNFDKHQISDNHCEVPEDLCLCPGPPGSLRDAPAIQLQVWLCDMVQFER